MAVTPEQIFDNVTGARTDIGGVGTALGGVGTAVGGIGGFLGIGGGGPQNIAGALQGAILDEDFLKGLLEKALKEAAKLIGQLADVLVKGFGDAFADSDIQEKFWDAIADLVEKLLDILLEALQAIANFPKALGKGPLDALENVRDLGIFLEGCGRLDVVKERIKAVNDSLSALFDLTNDSDIGGAIFGSIFGSLTGALEAVLTTTDDIATILFDQIKLIVFPKKEIVDMIRKLAKGEMWAWATLPSGLLGGQLNSWLNDPVNYKTLGGGATAEEEKRHRDTQREFRIRMVAVADSYLRRQLGDQKSPLTMADERISAQTISDVIIIFLENVIGFSLEPRCYPQADLEWDGFEDIGFRFGAMLAKQVRVIIRGTLGLLLRGAWEYSLHSDTLVEMIATIIGAAVSAFVEGCLRSIAFSFQIVSRYPGSSVGNTFVALDWKSLETIEDTGADADQLEYVALFRGPCDAGAVIPDRIKGLVKDIGAYIDAAYRQVKFESKFVALSVTDKITITRAELRGNQLVVWATTTATFQLPQPVLRAYVCCDVLAMRPGIQPSDPYTIDINLSRLPRCADIFVLSNRGGVARRSLIIS